MEVRDRMTREEIYQRANRLQIELYFFTLGLLETQNHSKELFDLLNVGRVRKQKELHEFSREYAQELLEIEADTQWIEENQERLMMSEEEQRAVAYEIISREFTIDEYYQELLKKGIITEELLAKSKLN